MYAELDVHRKIPPPKPRRTDIIEGSTPDGEPKAVSYVTVNPYARPRIPPKVYAMYFLTDHACIHHPLLYCSTQAANFTGEVVYYSTAN